MNIVDTVINYLAPEAAYRRAAYRKASEELFSYDAAKTGRRTEGWYSSGTDANVEIGAGLQKVRDRSRDLVRNNPYAAKAISEIKTNVVGTGAVPRAKTGSTALDKIIDAEWPYFVENVDPGGRYDFYGLQSMAVGAVAESGDHIVQVFPRTRTNLRVPLQLQALEGDYLDINRSWEIGTTGRRIIQGIEIDEWGKPVNYWLFNDHPGGLQTVRGGLESKAVPAHLVMHQYVATRPGQLRGMPWLAPVMMLARDMDDWLDAEQMRKKTEACLVAAVTSPHGNAGLPLGKPSTDAASGNMLERMYPGMIWHPNAGEDVKFNTPAAVGGFREYLTTQLKRFAAGIGVPFELLANDFSETTYSSFKGGQIGFRNTLEAFRWLTLTPMLLRPTWKRFIDTLVLTGVIPEANYGVSWTFPKAASVEPLKDALAETEAMQNLTLTLPEAIAANGYDFGEQIAEIALAQKTLDAAGIKGKGTFRDAAGTQAPQEAAKAGTEKETQPKVKRSAARKATGDVVEFSQQSLTTRTFRS